MRSGKNQHHHVVRLIILYTVISLFVSIHHRLTKTPSFFVFRQGFPANLHPQRYCTFVPAIPVLGRATPAASLPLGTLLPQPRRWATAANSRSLARAGWTPPQHAASRPAGRRPGSVRHCRRRAMMSARSRDSSAHETTQARPCLLFPQPKFFPSRTPWQVRFGTCFKEEEDDSIYKLH